LGFGVRAKREGGSSWGEVRDDRRARPSSEREMGRRGQPVRPWPKRRKEWHAAWGKRWSKRGRIPGRADLFFNYFSNPFLNAFAN